MAYEVANPIKRIGGYNGVTHWAYTDGDDAGTMDTAGYFNLEAKRLKIGDIIFAFANSVPVILVVNANSRDVTATPPVQGVVDTTSDFGIGAADSD